ncbi:MAG: hypothetical protein K0R65_934 [Crocinitomicaceae bacterium]|jgi:hypothetical protein|nr:hypothetical protein [Crocinitomicaceae bacterium]
MKYKLLILSALPLLLFFSCKKDKPEDPVEEPKEIQMDLVPYFGSQQLYLDSVYTTDENYLIQFQEVRLYMSNFAHEGRILPDVALFNLRQTQHAFLKTQADAGDFTSINAYLGIDSLRNHADPSSFPTTSPLNVMNANDMHWGWNPGYIFMYIDAKIDTIPDATVNLDHFLSFHIGKDQFKQNLFFSNVPWTAVSGTLSKATLKLDLKQFLYAPYILDLKGENISHTGPGQDDLSLRLIRNFANALHF